MFFGGKGAKVQMHFDIDYADIFLCHFGGKKKITLFSPQQGGQIWVCLAGQKRFPLRWLQTEHSMVLPPAEGRGYSIGFGASLYKIHKELAVTYNGKKWKNGSLLSRKLEDCFRR